MGLSPICQNIQRLDKFIPFIFLLLQLLNSSTFVPSFRSTLTSSLQQFRQDECNALLEAF
uniref:Uncharacterized protein n=1 Tax=Parascaris univalens TaxID=6257 RepID=A0A915B356_PARUN